MAQILSVVHYYPPHVGGMEIVAYKQAHSLAAAGFHSRVVTCALDTSAAAPAGQAIEGEVIVTRVPALNTLDRRFGLPFPFLGLSALLTLRREVRRADLIHLHDVFYLTSWLAFLWAWWYRRPVVLTQHVALVEHPSAAVMAIQKLVYATVGRAIFRSARRIVVYNNNVRTFLAEQGVPTKRVSELRNGIDTRQFTPAPAHVRQALRVKYGLPQERPIALFVGRLVPKKGFDRLLQARSDHYHLVFVGPGSATPPQEAGRDNMTFLGARTQEELAELYQACDLFVFPAVGEILTLVMQEAMAAGLPVVTTNDPAYAQYDLDPGLIRFVPPEPQALRMALEELALNPALRHQMSAYSRTVAERQFDWDANFNRLLGLYRPLLEPL